MNWMDKLEKKMGRYAIPKITRFFIIANILGTLLYYMNGTLTYYITCFDVASILHGQIWRLISWILIPSGSLSILGLLFMLCLWMLGDSLEQYLGTFRMNVYFWGGILLNDIVGILVYLIFKVSMGLSMYYLLFSLYLMLGLFMPNAEVRLYFVLPIRMKWLNIVYFIMLAYDVYTYFKMGLVYGIQNASVIVLAIVNLLFFVYSCKSRLSFKQKRRQKQFQSQFKPAPPRPGSGITVHKCAICGRTEVTNPELTFRYCSKCKGSYEYCSDHLFTHNHVI